VEATAPVSVEQPAVTEVGTTPLAEPVAAQNPPVQSAHTEAAQSEVAARTTINDKNLDLLLDVPLEYDPFLADARCCSKTFSILALERWWNSTVGCKIISKLVLGGG